MVEIVVDLLLICNTAQVVNASLQPQPQPLLPPLQLPQQQQLLPQPPLLQQLLLLQQPQQKVHCIKDIHNLVQMRGKVGFLEDFFGGKS